MSTERIEPEGSPAAAAQSGGDGPAGADLPSRPRGPAARRPGTGLALAGLSLIGLSLVVHIVVLHLDVAVLDRAIGMEFPTIIWLGLGPGIVAFYLALFAVAKERHASPRLPRPPWGPRRRTSPPSSSR